MNLLTKCLLENDLKRLSLVIEERLEKDVTTDVNEILSESSDLEKQIMALAIIYSLPVKNSYNFDEIMSKAKNKKASKIEKCLVNLAINMSNIKVFSDGLFKIERLDENTLIYSVSNENKIVYTLINNGKKAINYSISKTLVECSIYRINELKNIHDRKMRIHVLGNTCVIVALDKNDLK